MYTVHSMNVHYCTDLRIRHMHDSSHALATGCIEVLTIEFCTMDQLPLLKRFMPE